jgi:hypothetical protein
LLKTNFYNIGPFQNFFFGIALARQENINNSQRQTVLEKLFLNCQAFGHQNLILMQFKRTERK